MLPDDTYDVFIIDATDADENADENTDANANVTRLELTVTSGAHKGDVIALRAANLGRDSIDLIGLPARLRVHDGTPTIDFEEG
jgi:hypothetical protein